jgi:hypothetical protein
MAGFATVTLVVAVEVLVELSVERAMSVTAPFASAPVFHDTEYNVPLGIDDEPMSVEVDMIPW